MHISWASAQLDEYSRGSKAAKVQSKSGISQGAKGVTLIGCTGTEPQGSGSTEEAGVGGGTSKRPGFVQGDGRPVGCVNGSGWVMEEED